MQLRLDRSTQLLQLSGREANTDLPFPLAGGPRPVPGNGAVAPPCCRLAGVGLADAILCLSGGPAAVVGLLLPTGNETKSSM